MPKMLGEIVARLIDEQEDMKTVSSPVTEDRLIDQIEASGPTVLLMSCAHAEARAKAQTILERQPNVKVIALTANGREATLYALRPYEKSMGTMSPETLIEVIREVVKC